VSINNEQISCFAKAKLLTHFEDFLKMRIFFKNLRIILRKEIYKISIGG
jgi:hypothetical protein